MASGRRSPSRSFWSWVFWPDPEKSTATGMAEAWVASVVEKATRDCLGGHKGGQHEKRSRQTSLTPRATPCSLSFDFRFAQKGVSVIFLKVGDWERWFLFECIRYADIEGGILIRKNKCRRKVLGSGIRTGVINIVVSIFRVLVRPNNRTHWSLHSK